MPWLAWTKRGIKPLEIIGSSCREGRFRHVSDSGDSHFAARGRREPFYVGHIARQNHSLVAHSHRHHNGVNDVRHSGLAQQAPCFVGLPLAKRHDQAAGQETPELDLLR